MWCGVCRILLVNANNKKVNLSADGYLTQQSLEVFLVGNLSKIAKKDVV